MLPSVSKEIVPNHSERSLRIVRFSTREIVNNLTIQQWFLGNEITVLHIGLEYQNSRDLVVVDGPCLQAIAQTTDDFTIEDVNPTKPSRGERNVFGISEADREGFAALPQKCAASNLSHKGRRRLRSEYAMVDRLRNWQSSAPSVPPGLQGVINQSMLTMYLRR